jgi:hypothetical protein
VAEDSPIAGGKQCGNEETILGDQLRRDRRIDATVEAVQPSAARGRSWIR